MIFKFINIIIARHMANDSYVKANRVGFSCVLKKLCDDHDLIMVNFQFFFEHSIITMGSFGNIF